ncbi:MAG: sugar phosphate isomerase/epimerase family protein [Oscillospiraceae bacterium]
MKLALSNIAWPARDDVRMYSFMKALGFLGLEIAPTRVFEMPVYDKNKEAAGFSDMLAAEYGMAVCSVQSIWYGRTEKLFGAPHERALLLDYTKRAVDFAAALNCRNLVFGCPKNRAANGTYNEETALLFFSEVAEYAAQNGCVLALEANPAIYETDFINTTSEAFGFCRKVGLPGLKVNLDFGTVIENGEDFGAVSENIDLVSHVHISEPFLKPIAVRNEHKALRKVLEDGGYKGFVSVEMGSCDSLSFIESAAEYLCGVFK